MNKVFISYRRDDSAAVVGRIYDRLIAHFGRDAVFKDVDSIPYGAKFAEYIRSVLQQCAVQLVVIGPHWLSIAHPNGTRRLDDLADFVRMEIEAALELEIPIIPVLVQGAGMPQAGALPGSLRELPHFNGLPVRYDPDFDGDMRRLIGAVDHWIDSRAMPSPSGSPEPAVVHRSRTEGPIMSGGEPIYPVELEDLIMSLPEVLEAAVVGIPSEMWQQRPVAYVVCRPWPAKSVTAEDITSFLLAREVPRWWLPDEIIFTGAIPKTDKGEFGKNALLAQYAATHPTSQ